MEELFLEYCRVSNISFTTVTSCPRVSSEDHDETMDDIDVSTSLQPSCIEDEEDDSMGDVEKFVLGLQNIEN
ncbi:hypothetical protein ACET3Z_005271 [Daucus carota]